MEYKNLGLRICTRIIINKQKTVNIFKKMMRLGLSGAIRFSQNYNIVDY